MKLNDIFSAQNAPKVGISSLRARVSLAIWAGIYWKPGEMG
jgi:hypothetical protein